jgi:sugar phosphate isomerase/epimerase
MDDGRLSFALCNEIFGDRDPAWVFATAARMGYDGVELAPFTLAERVSAFGRADRLALARAAESAGIRIAGLHWLLVTPKGLHVTTPDAQVRRRTFDYLGELVELAGDLGADVMVLGSPKQRSLLPGQDRDEAMHAAAEGLREVGERAGRHGIRFCLEALHPQETNFLNTIEEVIELLALVDNPHIRYMLDVKAMSGMPGTIVETIRRYGRDSGHIHVNEPSGLAPGMGGFPFDEIMEAIVHSGYQGWVSVEPFNYEPDPETVGRTALAALKKGLERKSV